MQLLVTSKIGKVKYPRGEAYARAIANAKRKPKKFAVPFKKKGFFIVNIIYYLSQEHPAPGYFPIPVRKIATVAQTKPGVVYALLDDLKKKGFIKVVNENYIPKVKGQLYVWLADPVN